MFFCAFEYSLSKYISKLSSSSVPCYTWKWQVVYGLVIFDFHQNAVLFFLFTSAMLRSPILDNKYSQNNLHKNLASESAYMFILCKRGKKIYVIKRFPVLNDCFRCCRKTNTTVGHVIALGVRLISYYTYRHLVAKSDTFYVELMNIIYPAQESIKHFYLTT